MMTRTTRVGGGMATRTMAKRGLMNIARAREKDLVYHAWSDCFCSLLWETEHYDVSSSFFVAMDFFCFESPADGASMIFKLDDG
jgi:hypothetical protein